MSENIAPWLVTAKVSPPKSSLGTCRRDGLLERLRTGAGITVIEAPAGFGKTQLLSQWRECQLDGGRRVAWLSMDEADDPDICVAYLAFAFHKGGVDMTACGLMSPGFHGVRTSFGLGLLLRAIEEAGTECTLVLDDVERAAPQTVNEILNPLLRMRPANLSVCIAFRSNPGLTLSRFGVQGVQTTLHPPDLRFSRAEVQRWLEVQGHGSGATDAIMQRTDGWPVALQLIKSAAGPECLLADAIAGFAGSGREAAAYFREQLLRHLPEEVRGFLRDTSILEHVRADSADFIRETTDSKTLVMRLHDRLEGVFAPLENDVETYRLHPLVREYLRDELREHAIERHEQLCARAARWLAAQGQGISAMRYALEGRDPALAATIFEDMGAAQLWLHEGMGRLTMALSLLADHDLPGFPRIHVARSLACAKIGDMRNARRAHDRARQISGDFTRDHPGGDDMALMVDGRFIGLLLTEYGCSPRSDSLEGPEWARVLDYVRDDLHLYAFVLTWQCLFNSQVGNFEAGVGYGRASVEVFRQSGSRYGELFVYLHFGMAEMARGRLRATLDEYLKTLRIVRADFPGDAGVRRICNIALGELYWESGDSANARKYLRNVARHIRQPEAWFDLYMAAYQTSLEFLFEESGAGSAHAFLEEAREHATEQGLARLGRYLEAVYMLLLCRQGYTDEALAWLEQHRTVLGDDAAGQEQLTWREMEALVQARAHAALLCGAAGRARELLHGLADYAAARRIQRMLLHALLLLACVDDSEGHGEAAEEHLRRALRIAADEHYVRPFLREYRRLQPLLARLPVAQFRPVEQDFLRELLVLGAGREREVAEHTFSPREMEIMQEISRGQTDKLIARAIGLSAHGVRYHLKNIYAKMGVQNRTQALSRARELGLL